MGDLPYEQGGLITRAWLINQIPHVGVLYTYELKRGVVL